MATRSLTFTLTPESIGTGLLFGITGNTTSTDYTYLGAIPRALLLNGFAIDVDTLDIDFTVAIIGGSCDGTTKIVLAPGGLVYYWYSLYSCTDQLPNLYYTVPLLAGTYSTGERVQGAAGHYYVIVGSTNSATGTPPSGTMIMVSGENAYGCP